MGTGELFSKRAVAVLDAPAETPAPERPRKPRTAKKNLLLMERPVRAGHLEDFNVDAGGRGVAGAGTVRIDEGRLSSKLGTRGGLRLRFRQGLVPASTWGWVASVAFLALGAAVCTGAAFAAARFLRSDPRFTVPSSSAIQTIGNTHLTRAQMLSIFGGDVERNIFSVSLTQRQAELESLPWVEHATVMRLLPNRIRVAIVERTPVAFARQGSQIGLVDGSGVLLDMPLDAPGNPKYSFPVVTGLRSEDPVDTRGARMKIYKAFTTDLDSDGGKVSETLSEVDLSDPEDVKALIPGGRVDVLVHFGDKDFLNRYRKFEAHLPEWMNQYPKLASVDMRYERQVVLEMQAGSAVPVSSATGEVLAENAALAPAKKNAGLSGKAAKIRPASLPAGRAVTAAKVSGGRASAPPTLAHVATRVPTPPGHAPGTSSGAKMAISPSKTAAVPTAASPLTAPTAAVTKVGKGPVPVVIQPPAYKNAVPVKSPATISNARQVVPR